MLYSRRAWQRERWTLQALFFMKKRILSALVVAVTLLSAALLLSGCGGKKSVPKNAIAVYRDQVVTRAQFNAMMAENRSMMLAAHKQVPKVGTTNYEQIRAAAIKYLVLHAIYESEANKLGIVVTDAQVEQRLQTLVKQQFKGSIKALEGAAKAQGITLASVRSGLRTVLLTEQLRKKIIAGVTVTEKDVKDYYDQNKSRYKQPASRGARHILVKTKAQADKISKQLKAGASFAALARKYSIDPGSRKNGGELTGGVTKGQMVPAFEKATFALKTGEISKPIKTQFGWHIIEALSGIKPAHVLPIAQVESSIRPLVLEQKQQKAVTDWVAKANKRIEDDVTYQTGFAPSPDVTPLFTSTTTATTS
jgi:parvulin-like peptidyl-prolyl isomerase